MADAVAWSLDVEFPPMRAVDYRKAAAKVVAEWMRAAGVTCDEDYHLTSIVEQIEAFIIGEMKAMAVRPRLPISDLIKPAMEE